MPSVKVRVSRRSLERGFVVLSVLAIGGNSSACHLQKGDPRSNDAAEAQRRNEEESKALNNAEPLIEQRRRGIQAELQTLGAAQHVDAPMALAPAWAGEYYVGDGLGMNVSIAAAPKAGIVYTWHGCLGLYDGNYGDITGEFDDDADGKFDGIIVKWTLNRTTGYGYNDTKWYFVRWPGPDGADGRRYLIPESKLIDVVNNYNEGGYARDGMYSAPLMWEKAKYDSPHQSREAPVAGVPQLPRKWAALLLRDPLSAKVTKVIQGAPETRKGVQLIEAHVWLDKGRAEGMFIGMRISIGEVCEYRGDIEITKVEEHSCEGTHRVFPFIDKPAPLTPGESIRIAAGTERQPQGATK